MTDTETQDRATIDQNGHDVAEAAPDGTEEDALATLQAERDAFLDQLQRSRAEFANYRKRVDSDRALLRERATQDLLTQVLPVLDDLQRALAAVPDDQRETGWVSGTQMIERKLAAIMERFGVSPIDALGQAFDPAVHEAVATDPGSSGERVVEVYQTGYRLGQTLLRPAMVKTGDAPVA